MSKRLLLISNSTHQGQRYLQHAEEPIKQFLGDGVKEVLFIPFAIVLRTYDQYAAIVGERFAAMGYRLTSIHTEDPHRAVGKAQAIVVGGGNTFHLLKTICDTDLLKVIRYSVDTGVPYIGWSAGANIACPTIQTTNDMPVVWPTSLEALDLVPFQINPHYTDDVPPGFNGETRADRIAEFTAINKNTYVVGMREGAILKLEGTHLTLVGDRTVKIFYNTESPAEYGHADPIDFVLRQNLPSSTQGLPDPQHAHVSKKDASFKKSRTKR